MATQKGTIGLIKMFLASGFWFLVFCFQPQAASSQQPASQSEYSLAKYYTDSATISFGVLGEYSINSTALNNEFYNFFIRGGYIDTDAKDRVSGRLRTSNRLGGDLNLGIYYAQKIDSLFGKARPGLNYFINISNRWHFDVRFSDDLFNLGFYGNKGLAGQTAGLGSFNLNLLKYQQFELGMLNRNDSGKKYGFGISLLKGEEHLYINANKVDLYTETTGDYIDLDMNLKINQSDTADRGLQAFNGWGLSTGMFYQLSYNLFRENDHWKGFIRFEINDLGFIRWNYKSLNYTKDTTFRFEGIEIDDIFAIEDSILQLTIDSSLNYYEPLLSRGVYATFLPTSLHLSLFQQKNDGLFFTTGIISRIFANYAPYIYVKPGYVLKDKYIFSSTLGYGGYGRFNFGLGAQVIVAGFYISIGANNLEGLIFPKHFGGNSAYLSVRKVF